MSATKQAIEQQPETVRPDDRTIKDKQQAAGASGDFAAVGTALQIVGETLAEAADVRAGERVLDVAAGNGNATLAAARRFARVTSTDRLPALLAKGAARAKAEGLAVTFETADAEALPFADETFDLVLSIFGVMFAPDHQRAAAEILRVVRRKGRIGLASWTPEGFVGQLFKVIGRHIPARGWLPSPALWGTEPHIVQLFGRDAIDIRSVRKLFKFRYESPAHWIRVFRDYYGPTHKAFEALGESERLALEAELTTLLEGANVGGRHSLVVPGEYLEVIIVKD